MRVGYVRVSSIEQNTARQLDGIDVEHMFVDRVSGKATAHYAQIRGRRGVQKAVGAICHDILIAYWHIVYDSTEYRELGAGWTQRRRSIDAQQKRLVAQLEKLGLKVTVEPEQPAA
ncbi:hypothetical protein ND748_00200 [Frankia sp. AiPs1]|nr:hypothetical protein [Frankia sp. AiPs1]MCM3920117.1 hypothetical protein [Frankia sp. AiPs1]